MIQGVLQTPRKAMIAMQMTPRTATRYFVPVRPLGDRTIYAELEGDLGVCIYPDATTGPRTLTAAECESLVARGVWREVGRAEAMRRMEAAGE